MGHKKASEVNSWLAQQHPETLVTLFYGPNYGLVCERAKAFIASFGFNPHDPFSTACLDATEMNTSGRLLQEARTLSMFVQRRLLWVRHANNQKALIDDLQKLIADSPPNVTVILEAGELKKSSALRSTVEKAKEAMALPCFEDTAREIDFLIHEEINASGVKLTREAQLWIKENLGGDRYVNRSELQKLSLYGFQKGSLELKDVQALLDNNSQSSMDELVEALLAENSEKCDSIFQNFIKKKEEHLSLLISITINQFQNLHLMKAALDRNKGKGMENIISEIQPHAFFTRRKLIEKVLRNFSSSHIETILEILQKTTLEMRKHTSLAEAIASQAFLRISGAKKGSMEPGLRESGLKPTA